MNPNSAKKAAVTERLAAVNRALRNRPTSSSGWRTRRSHRTKIAEQQESGRAAGDDEGVGPAAVGCLDDRPHDEGHAGGGQQEAEVVHAPGLGIP